MNIADIESKIAHEIPPGNWQGRQRWRDIARELIAVKVLLGRVASRMREIETSYGTLIDEAEKAAK